MAIFEALAGPLLNIGTDLIARNQSKIANEHQRQWQEAMAQKNIDLQKEFAQNGIRWKVEDAKAAGIHPLYALGAGGASFSPVSSVGGPDRSNADFFHSAGQNVSRAISATQSTEDKELAALRLAGARADVEGKALDNQLRAAKLKDILTPTPGLPVNGDSGNFIPGQGTPAGSGLVKNKPLERVYSAPDRPAQEAGWRPDVAYSRTDTGLTPVVPESLSESLEDDIIGKAMWRMRNQLVPNITGGGKPSMKQLPKGYDDWSWSYLKQEWQPSRKTPQKVYQSRFKDRLY